MSYDFTGKRKGPPVGVDDKFFFMHISKTGGSSVIDVMRTCYAESQLCLFAEQYSPYYAEITDRIDRLKFCSGHFYIDDWNQLAGSHSCVWRKVTLVRDPFEQLASHLRWVDSYNLSSRQSERALLPPEMQVLVAELRQVEFSNPESLDRYLTNLSPLGIAYFDNLQSRYFISGWRYAIDRHRPLDLSLSTYIRDSIRQFDFIGHLSHFSETLSAFAAAGLGRVHSSSPEIANKNINPRKIDFNEEWTRKVLQKRLIVDGWLSEYVLSMNFRDRAVVS